jgi:hypothetical protein
MQLRSQWPWHVQGDAGHPSYQSGGHKKNNQKKWRAEEEEKQKGLLSPPEKIYYLDGCLGAGGIVETDEPCGKNENESLFKFPAKKGKEIVQLILFEWESSKEQLGSLRCCRLFGLHVLIPTSRMFTFKMPNFKKLTFKMPISRMSTFKMPTSRISAFKKRTFRMSAFKKPTFRM